MDFFQVALVACLLLACGAPAARELAQRPSPAFVVVDRPTVIGFFPPPKDSVEANEDWYAEGVAHVGFALQDAEACLGRDESRVVLVIDTAVRIRRGGRTDTIRFSRVDSLSYGAYLIVPGGKPRLISVYGPSQLIPAVVEAIPEYFGRLPCGAK